ncbi:MAG: hypothetical protein FJ146_17295 [Deltaproteobacteria bacterium]|nr:hypothetical protein [Deltaproteobacteria bacterium]
MAMRRLACLTGGLLALLGGCKFASASKVTHDFGQIANAGDLLIDCDQKNKPSAPADAAALQYLRDHVKKIIESNQAVLPPGIHRLCTFVDATYDVNAYASGDGIVAINRGLLWIASNDAQIAAVVAHEIAHMASLHSIGGKAKGKIADDKEYQATREKLRSAFKGITNNKGAQFNSAFAELAATLSNALKGADDGEKLVNQYINLIVPMVDRTIIKFELFNLNEPRNIAHRIVTEMPLDDANREVAWNYKEDEVQYKGYEDIVRMMQSHRVLIVERMQQADREKFVKVEANAMIECEKFLTSSKEYRSLLQKLREIELKYLGKDVAPNWKEQDADEKGLELFIRAGYDPREFANVFDLLGKSRQYRGEVPAKMIRDIKGSSSASPFVAASCHIADRVDTNKCERGDSTHPNSCWRSQNVYDELEKHKTDYAPFLGRAKATNVFGSKLADLQAYYFSGTMSKASTSAAKAEGACVDLPPDRDTCADKKSWGQCNEPWMRSNQWCRCTCDY